MGRGVETERGAVARLQRSLHVRRLPLAAADQREAADHRAHLVVEETAGGGVDMDLVAFTRDLEPVEGLDRAVGLALGRSEGGEVVAPDEVRRALAHCFDIEWNGDVPDAPEVEGRRGASIEDSVEVPAANARKPRMPVVSDRYRLRVPRSGGVERAR